MFLANTLVHATKYQLISVLTLPDEAMCTCNHVKLTKSSIVTQTMHQEMWPNDTILLFKCNVIFPRQHYNPETTLDKVTVVRILLSVQYNKSAIILLPIRNVLGYQEFPCLYGL